MSHLFIRITPITSSSLPVFFKEMENFRNNLTEYVSSEINCHNDDAFHSGEYTPVPHH